jgi:DNA-binding CsgD family transcriptional regulator
MELLLEGKSVSEIGYRFDRKINTITTIKNNLYKKMGVANFVELTHAQRYFQYMNGNNNTFLIPVAPC